MDNNTDKPMNIMEKPKKKKGLAGLLLKLFLVFLSLIVLALAVLFVTSLFLRKDVRKFLPSRFLVYAQVPSLKTVYEDWYNLEAADIVFAGRELAYIQKVLNDFRTYGISRHPLFKELLNVKAHMVIGPQFEILAAFDLDWRSMVSILAPYAGGLINVKKLTVMKKDGLTVFHYDTGYAYQIYVTLMDNVALLSTSLPYLQAAVERYKSGDNLAGRGDRLVLDRMDAQDPRSITFLADTMGILDGKLPGELGSGLIKTVKLPRLSLLNVLLNNKEARFRLNISPETALPELSNVLVRRPDTLSVLRHIPETSYLLTALNLGRFSDLYRLASSLSGKALDENFKKADDAARLLFGAGIEEAFFGWMGSEAGVFFTAESPDPVFFCRIEDKAKFSAAFDKLLASMVLEGDSSLVVDGIRVSRLALPDFLRGVVGMFGFDVPSPYYLTEGDFLFLSLGAENLARVVQTTRTGKSIARAPHFQKLLAQGSGNAGLLLYYDLDKTLPFFLKGEGKVEQVLKLYGKGLASVYPDNGEWVVSVAAMKAGGGSVRLYPGYPVDAGGTVSPDTALALFEGGSTPWLCYVRNRTEAVLFDTLELTSTNMDVEEDTVLLSERKGPTPSIYGVSPRGTVYRFDRKGRSIPPYSMQTGIVSALPPFMHSGRVWLYSRDDKRMTGFDPSGNREIFPYEIPGQLQALPAVTEGFWAFYPRIFGGKLTLVNARGAVMENWPRPVDGLSYGGPVFYRGSAGLSVALVNQNGALAAWALDGGEVPGTPLQLGSQVYKSPVAVKTGSGGEGLLIICGDGTLRLLDPSLRLIAERKLSDLNGRETSAVLKDVSGDGIPEIFLYGDKNSISGLDQKLRDLPGFPVKGRTEPHFTDLNGDGKPEMLTITVDGKISAYTLSFKED